MIDSAPSVEPQVQAAPRTAVAKKRREHYDRVIKHVALPNSSSTSPNTLQSPAMSFVMLSQSQIGTAADSPSAARTQHASPKQPSSQTITQESLSQSMSKATKLFESLSARSDIDHPICSECTDLLLTALQQRCQTISHERDAYTDFVKRAQQNVPTEAEQDATHKALLAAQHEEQEALAELEALEAERAAVEREIAHLDQQALDLESDQEAYYAERNAFEADLSEMHDQRDSLRNQLAHESATLEALQRTNVYNDTFCIGHDGHFGTINGLRLGRLPDHTVEWPEINAAWGQAVLLLVIVAEKLSFTFDGYRLLPIGSTSKIERLDYPSATSSAGGSTKPKITQHNLYTSGDLPLGLGFLQRGFDNAMVCFLQCLAQLGEHVARTTANTSNNGTTSIGAKMPYAIVKDKIGDTSIKLGAFNQDEAWTKACKYTLTCCKFLLAHASHVDDRDQVRKPNR